MKKKKNAIYKHMQLCSSRVDKIEKEVKWMKWLVLMMAFNTGKIILNDMHGWEFILKSFGL